MATLTTSYQLLGSVKTSTYSQLRLYGKYNSQNTTANTSSVSLQLRLYGNGGSGSFSSGTAIISGTSYSLGNTSYSKGSEKTLCTKTYTASHDNSGNYTASISYSLTSSSTPSGSGTASITLPQIKRTSVIGNISNFTFGNNITITYTEYVASYTANLDVIINNIVCASRTNIASGSTLTLTNTELTNCYNAAPNTGTPTVSFRLTTKSGSTTIGTSTKTATGTIPSSVQPPNPSIGLNDYMGYEQTYGGYVQGKSKINGIIIASGSTGSSVSSYSTTTNGQILTGQTFVTDVLNTSGSNAISTTITDSRGRTATTTGTYNVLEYNDPTIETFRVTRCDSLGNETDEGSYIKINATATITPLNNLNAKTFTIQYKLHDGDTWTTLTTYNTTYTYTLEDSIHSGFSSSNFYDFKLTATDNFSSQTSLYELPTAKAVLDFYKDGTGVAIGKVAQTPDLFEVAHNTKINGTLKLADANGDNPIEVFDLTGTPRYDSTQSYSAGDYCIYNDSLYKCITATTGTFDSDDWSSTNIMTEIGSGGGGGGGTSNYNDLTNKPSINSVTLSGNKSLSDLGINIPTQTSQLINNSGFIEAKTFDLDNIEDITSTSDATYIGIKNCIDNNLPFKIEYLDLSSTNTYEVIYAYKYSNIYEFSYETDFSIETIKLSKSGTSVTVTKTYKLLQEQINSTNKLDYSLLSNTPTIPTQTSDLTNDSGFITSSSLPTKTSDLTNDSGFITKSVNNLSNYTNNATLGSVLSGYQTIIDSTNKLDYDYLTNTPTIPTVPTTVSSFTNDAGYITSSSLPTKVSDLTNDTGFITSSSLPTKTSDLTNDSGFITSSDLPTNHVTTDTAQDVTGAKTFKNIMKIQNGQGTGSMWIGGDVNANTLKNNTRHLARIVVPTYADVTKGATLLGFDSSGDSDMNVTNKGSDVVSFGGMKKITNATSPMAIGFCVATERNGMAANKKVYPMEMDSSQVRFNVQPNYNGTNLATTTQVNAKQDSLVSGTNIKTINNQSLLGSGNINISSGGGTATDVQINGSSIVQNDVANLEVDGTYSSSNKIATMSSLPTVPTNVSAFNNDSGYITGYTETDPVFSASASAGITSTDISNWNGKSNFSGDYDDLTNKPTLFSGDYTDLTNKPTIPDISGLIYTENVTLATNMTVAGGASPATQTKTLSPKSGYTPVMVTLHNVYNGAITFWYLNLDSPNNTISWRVRNNTNSQATGLTIMVKVLYVKTSSFLGQF